MLARPRAVVVENVCEACAVGPISGLLGRVQGYALEGGELDPRDVAGACVSRSRYYWVLTRVEERVEPVERTLTLIYPNLIG